MNTDNYLKILVESIHSATVATIGADGHPQTCIIDMMLWDDRGVYFLTAKGKDFYRRLTQQGYISLSAVKDKVSVSLRGRIECIGTEKLDEIFEKNTYMQSIYPEGTRSALEVFRLYEAEGEYFDISDPAHILRDSFAIGGLKKPQDGYFVKKRCDGCAACLKVCPQRCIDAGSVPFVIDQNRCIRCGLCAIACEKHAIEIRGKLYL